MGGVKVTWFFNASMVAASGFNVGVGVALATVADGFGEGVSVAACSGEGAGVVLSEGAGDAEGAGVRVQAARKKSDKSRMGNRMRRCFIGIS